MSNINVNDLFNKYIHGKIERLARNGKCRFVSRRPEYFVTRPKYELIEEYHISQPNEELALYAIVKDIAHMKISWDLHYDMNIGETAIHIQEADTEFVKRVQQLLYDNYTKQNVR